MATIDEIRDLPVKELDEEALGLRKELALSRMKIATDASNLLAYRQARKKLAQVLTVRAEKSRSDNE